MHDLDPPLGHSEPEPPPGLAQARRAWIVSTTPGASSTVQRHLAALRAETDARAEQLERDLAPRAPWWRRLLRRD